MPYPFRVGISGLATAPVASCSGGSGRQGSRWDQHPVQPCPDHSLDVTGQGLEVDCEPDPLSSTYPKTAKTMAPFQLRVRTFYPRTQPYRLRHCPSDSALRLRPMFTLARSALST